MKPQYNKNGRRRRIACPCPKCKEPLTEVVNVSAEDGGETVRQRKCPACKHKWFTMQEPEYLLHPSCITWVGKKPQLSQTVADAFRLA
jgi:transcriptional regulator NrdR family protein